MSGRGMSASGAPPQFENLDKHCAAVALAAATIHSPRRCGSPVSSALIGANL
jgi:hypothetical protein